MIEVNYLAVLAAAVAAFIVGALWYGVFFQRLWMTLMGVTSESMAEARKKMSPAQAMALGFVATLLMTYVLAHLIILVGVTTVGGALTLGFWIWLGFIATIMLNSIIYENRPAALYLINVSHYLVALLVASAVLAWWPW